MAYSAMIISDVDKIDMYKRFLFRAREEIQKFRKMRDRTFLQQAGNKVYNAHILLMEIELSGDIPFDMTIGEAVKKMAEKHSSFKQINDNVRILHGMFYEGIQDESETMLLINSTINMLRKIRK